MKDFLGSFESMIFVHVRIYKVPCSFDHNVHLQESTSTSPRSITKVEQSFPEL